MEPKSFEDIMEKKTPKYFKNSLAFYVKNFDCPSYHVKSKHQLAFQISEVSSMRCEIFRKIVGIASLLKILNYRQSKLLSYKLKALF